jgi:hypothetical protein
VLMARGQAPLVFNEARGAIDWMCGTERKLRKDYKIRPRSQRGRAERRGQDQGLQVHRGRQPRAVAPLARLQADRHLGPRLAGGGAQHRSREASSCYSGSEDWRRVFRDSRGREFDQSDWRYIHRRKISTWTTPCALLPKAAQHLMSIAGRWALEDEEADDIWYLGQKLTAAHSAATEFRRQPVRRGLQGAPRRRQRCSTTAGAAAWRSSRPGTACPSGSRCSPTARCTARSTTRPTRATSRCPGRMGDVRDGEDAHALHDRHQVPAVLGRPEPVQPRPVPADPHVGLPARPRRPHLRRDARHARPAGRPEQAAQQGPVRAVGHAHQVQEGRLRRPRGRARGNRPRRRHDRGDGDPNMVKIEQAFNAQQVQGNLEMAQARHRAHSQRRAASPARTWATTPRPPAARRSSPSRSRARW